MLKGLITKAALIFTSIFLFVTTPLTADSLDEERKFNPSLLTIDATSGIEYPLETDFDLLTLGVNANLTGKHTIPKIPWLQATAGLSYSFLPVQAETSLSLLGIGAGPGFTFDITPRFIVEGAVSAGGYYGFFNELVLDEDGNAYENQRGGGGLWGADVKASFFLAPSFSIGLNLGWVQYIGLTQSLRASLKGSFHLEGLEKKVHVHETDFQNIFPSLYKYYDHHPAGTVTIKNEERFPIRDISVSVFVDQLMDNPTVSAGEAELLQGQDSVVDINVLFSDRILNLLETSRVTAEISVNYKLNGKFRQNTFYDTLILQNRNAVTWSDDRKASAFVTPKSPNILQFSKGIAGMVRETGPISVNQNIRMAMGLFEALSEYGLSYVVDPNTLPYENAVEQSFTVDFLQYPVETLGYRGGDCDDLTILYCSILESVGIKSGFITVPGHIFSAFCLDISPRDAKRVFFNSNELIFQEDSVWIPVETTLLAGGFNKAWEEGIKQWNEANTNENARLLPLFENWKTYEASGEPADISGITAPDINDVKTTYTAELSSFIDNQLYPQVSALQSRIRSSRNPIRIMNQLGILYARYGKTEAAKAQFERILETTDYVPSMINLGNIYYMENKLDEAFELFTMAEQQDNDNPVVLLNLAKINYEFANIALVNSFYSRALKISPELSENFSYLASTDENIETRASDIAAGDEKLIWDYAEEDQ